MAHSSPSLPSSSLSLEYSPTPSAISSLSCAGERFEAVTAFSAALRRALGERGPPIHVCSEPEPVEFAEGGPSMLNASGDVWINGASESESDVDEVVVTLNPPELVTGPFTHHPVSRGATATGKRCLAPVSALPAVVRCSGPLDISLARSLRLEVGQRPDD